MDVANLVYGVDTTQVAAGNKVLDQHRQSAMGAAQGAQTFQNTQGRIPGKVTPATNSLREQRETFRTLAASASLVGGPLGNLIGQMGMLTIGGQKINPVFVASAVAIGTMVAAGTKAVAMFADLQQKQAQIGGLLNITGSGQSLQSLNMITDRLSKLGTQSVQDIRAAELELLKFRQVSSSAFEPILKISQQLENSGFGTMKDAAVALAKAVTDPLENMDLLKDAGIRLSQSQITLAQNLYRTGQFAQAQKVIIDAATKAVGSNDAAATTLSASWGRLMNASTSLAESWGSQITKALGLVDAVNKLAEAMTKLGTVELSPTAKGAIAALLVGSAIGLAATGVGIPGSLAIAGLGLGAAGLATSAASQKAGPQPGSAADLRSAMIKRGMTPGNNNIDEIDALPGVRDFNAGQKALKDRVDAAVDSLHQQALAAGKSEVEMQAYNLIVSNGAKGNKAYESSIRSAVSALASVQFMKGVKDQFTQQTDALKTEAATFEMAAGKAAAYRFEQEAITQAKIKGIALGPQQIAQIHGEAQAVGMLTDQVERLKNARQAADAVSSALVDGLFDVVTGAKSASQAIKDFSLSILKMMGQAALAGSGPFAGLFGTSQNGGVFGTLLKGLFSGAAGTPAATSHGGGAVGRGVAPSHIVSPSVVPSLPRFHNGTGLAADERLAVLQTGEVVSSRAQVAAARGSRSERKSTVIVQNYSGQESSQRTAQGPDGEELIYVTIGKYFSSGRGDAAMQRYGQSPARVAR